MVTCIQALELEAGPASRPSPPRARGAARPYGRPNIKYLLLWPRAMRNIKYNNGKSTYVYRYGTYVPCTYSYT